jgi:hypothetical protein
MKPASNIPYVVAVVIMIVIAITAIVIITFVRPTQDNSGLDTLIVGIASSTTMGLLAFMKAQETRTSVNGRLDDFIREAKLAAWAEGKDEGIQQEQDRQEIRDHDADSKDQGTKGTV